MSNVSNNQFCVRNGAGYNEVFLSSQKDPNTSSEERNPSVTSPSKDKDLGTAGLEGDSSDGLDGAEPPIQSIIGPDGLKEFIMLPIWMVNYFISTIKEFHFKTLRAKYQIPVNIPLRLPYILEKCCYKGVEGVRVYEQMLKAGLRFPLLSPLSIPSCGRHPNLPKCLEGLPWRGGLIWGHVQWSTEVDGGRIF